MGNSLFTAGLARHDPEAELVFSFHCFVTSHLHQCLPTSTLLSYHVHTLFDHHLCATILTTLVHEVQTYVLLCPNLCLTTSTSLSDHVHYFVLPNLTLGSPRPHMCHNSYHVHTIGSPHPHLFHCSLDVSSEF